MFYSMYGVFSFLSIIVVVIVYIRLRSRIIRLERKVESMRTGHVIDSKVAAPTTTSAPAVAANQGASSWGANTAQVSASQNANASIPVPVPPAPSDSGYVNEEVTIGERFGAWLKEDWLMKLGTLLLLIAFGWLASYAFANNWIGPMGRITLGIVAGAFLLVFGWFRSARYVHQGSIFMVLGSTVILLTVFAGRLLYGFFTPTLALIMVFASVAFVALASVVRRRNALALASLVLAGIAPLFTAAIPDEITLFAYLMVVTLGALWIVAIMKNRELTLAALVLYALYSFSAIGKIGDGDDITMLVFASAFAVIFFLANIVGLLRSTGGEVVVREEDTMRAQNEARPSALIVRQEKDMRIGLIAATINGLLLLTWIWLAAPVEWRSLIIVAWMIIFLVAAFVVYKTTGKKSPFYIYAGVSVVMLASATAAELEGAFLTIAYTFEVLVLACTANILIRDGGRAGLTMSGLMIVPVILSLESFYSQKWSSEIFHSDAAVMLIVGIVLFFLGVFFTFKTKHLAEEEKSSLPAWMIVVGSIYFYSLIWRVLHVIFAGSVVAIVLSLAIYTVIGLIAYFVGLHKGLRFVQRYGGFLLGIVVLRLIFVDVWAMELGGRVVTFFIIGILLMSTAFLGKRSKGSINSVEGITKGNNNGAGNGGFITAGIVAVFTLLSLCALAVSLGGRVIAATPNATSTADTVAAILESKTQAFRTYSDIRPDARIVVPTVVEVTLPQRFERNTFAVLNMKDGSLVPSLYLEKYEAKRNGLYVTTDVASVDPSAIIDGNLDSFTEFPVTRQNDALDAVTITLNMGSSLTTDGLNLMLDQYVALPATVEVRAHVGGASSLVPSANNNDGWRTMLAPLRPQGVHINFPKTTASLWQIRLTYGQPLRIAEIRFDGQEGTRLSERSLRFLAQPGAMYRIYSDADRPVSLAVGESPQLQNAEGVVRITTIASNQAGSKSNPFYVISDVDGDAIPDMSDNCIDVANKDQADINANGRGDACDDFDQDSVMNSKDNCPAAPNMYQEDADGDAIGDVCDDEESRITEKHRWLPWAGMGLGLIVLVGLFFLALHEGVKSKTIAGIGNDAGSVSGSVDQKVDTLPRV